MRVPGTARRPNQSILKEINLEYSLEGLMLKLKLQYFGHLMRRADSLQKTLMLGKIEGRRRSGQQRMRVRWHHQLNGHEFEQAPGDGERQGSLACCSPRDHRVRHSETTEQQQFGLQTIDAVLHLEFSSLILRRTSFFFPLVSEHIRNILLTFTSCPL